jgi:hypothetical protein
MATEQADFTTGGDIQAICQRCKMSFPAGTQLFYMQDRKPGRPGKYLCVGCHDYQVQKSETLQRTAGTQSFIT